MKPRVAWEVYPYDFELVDLEDLLQNVRGWSCDSGEGDMEKIRDLEERGRPRQLLLDLGVSPFAEFGSLEEDSG